MAVGALPPLSCGLWVFNVGPLKMTHKTKSHDLRKGLVGMEQVLIRTGGK